MHISRVWQVVGVGGVGIGVAMVAASCSSGRGPDARVEVAGKTSQAVTVLPSLNSAPAISTFVVYASQRVTLGSGDHSVGGDVGVATTTAATSQLNVGGSDQLDALHNLYSPSVTLGSGAIVGDVETNALTNNGAQVGTVAAYPSAMPPLPQFFPASAGATNVTVAQGQVQSLAPGSYGTLTDNGILNLAPGTYSFASVTLGNNAQLIAQQGGSTAVRIAGTLATGTSAQILAAGQANKLTVSVGGADGAGGTPPAVSLGANTQVIALLAATAGSLSFANNVQGTGAFAGVNVTAGTNVVFNFQSGFPVETPNLTTFVAYSELGITFGSASQALGGDVGVALPSAQVTLGAQDLLDAQHTLYASTATLGNLAQAGDLAVNTLDNNGGSFGTQVPYPSGMPLLPLSPPGAAGSTAVTVASGQQQTLNPGTFGALNDSGILFLNPGAYTFSSVTLGTNAQLVAQPGGPTTILVTGSFSTGSLAHVLPLNQSASALAIAVAGNDTSAGSAVSLGANTQIVALLSAPHGTLTLANGVQGTGAFLGFSITAGTNVVLQFQSGFPPTSSAPSGPPAPGYTLPPSSTIVGPVPANMPIGLAIVLPVQNNPALQTFNSQVSNPMSTQYRQYMDIPTFAANFGVLASEYAKLSPWATSFGLTPTTFPNNLIIDVVGPASQVEQALNANLVLALRPDGTQFYEPDRLPTPALPTSVDAVQGIDNYAVPTIEQSFTATGGFLFQGSDLRTAYLGTGTSCSTLTGAGQSIGIVSFDAMTLPGATSPDGGMVLDDFTAFVNATGSFSTPAPIRRLVDTATGVPSGGAGSSETAGDVEMAISMAPGAQVVLVEGTSIDSVLAALATTPNLNQISDSWAKASKTTQRWLDEFTAQGQSFFVSSGDAGQYDQSAVSCTCPCTTQMGTSSTGTFNVCSGSCTSTCATPNLACPTGNFAATLDGSPTDIRLGNNITLVGGTSLTTCSFSAGTGVCSGLAGTQAYQSEDAWNNSGGGFIAGTSLPDFQANVPTLVNASHRNSPDVSMPAVFLVTASTGCAPGAAVNNVCPPVSLQPGTLGPFSGTSASAPLWASYMALMNQQGTLATPALKPIGFPNEAFYQILNEPGVYQQAFHDIVGTTPASNPCGLGPTATPGWDSATGLGSPNGCNLMTAIATMVAPPQVTVKLNSLSFATTGFNICSACNCPESLSDLTVTCNPIVSPDGGVTPATVTQEVGCRDGHGALVSVTCSPSTHSPADAGNGNASRGIDVTVNVSLENSCGDNTPVDTQTFTANDVLPGEPQVPSGNPGGLLDACDFFGGDDFPCSILANGGACTFNSFLANVTSISNTGGFFRQSP